MHPDVNVDNLHAYLNDALKKLYPAAELKLGLKVKTPWDRGKGDSLKTTHFKDRIQAVHLQREGKHTATTAKLIKTILSSTLL